MKKITYLTECLEKGRTIRWAENVMPIKFYIAPFRWYKGVGDEYKYRQMVTDALKLWERAGAGKIKFEIVKALHDSQINLDWKRVDRKSLGHCIYNFDKIGRLYSAEVQIGLSDGIIHAQYMDENEVYHTIIHEIGHALGLNHSPNQTDIMYTPHQYGVVSLSAQDVNTLKWLYKFPHGKTPDEIANQYNSTTKNLDMLVLKLTNKNMTFEEVKNSIEIEQKDLLDETTKLAEIKKYQLLLQNIKLPDNF